MCAATGGRACTPRSCGAAGAPAAAAPVRQPRSRTARTPGLPASASKQVSNGCQSPRITTFTLVRGSLPIRQVDYGSIRTFFEQRRCDLRFRHCLCVSPVTVRAVRPASHLRGLLLLLLGAVATLLIPSIAFVRPLIRHAAGGTWQNLTLPGVPKCKHRSDSSPSPLTPSSFKRGLLESVNVKSDPCLCAACAQARPAVSRRCAHVHSNLARAALGSRCRLPRSTLTSQARQEHC